MFKLANYVLLALLFLQLTFWPLCWTPLPSSSDKSLPLPHSSSSTLSSPALSFERFLFLRSLTRLPYNYQTFHANPIDPLPLSLSPLPSFFHSHSSRVYVIRPRLFPPPDDAVVSCCNYPPMYFPSFLRERFENISPRGKDKSV